MKILVIDDEEQLRYIYGELFASRGYSVLTAGTPEAARISAEENHFDVITLDIRMPGTKGLELFDTLKKLQPSTPIIICTGIGYEETLLQEAQKKGAAGFVSKNLPIDQLLMEVHRVTRYGAK